MRELDSKNSKKQKLDTEFAYRMEIGRQKF